MVEEAKEILADGAREAIRRSPIIAMLILEIVVLLYFGWELLSGNALERAELRARNKELMEQVVECYRQAPRAKASVEQIARVSVQSDKAK